MVKFAFFVAYNLQRSVLPPWTAVFVPHRPPYLSEGVVVATTAEQQSPKGNW